MGGIIDRRALVISVVLLLASACVEEAEPLDLTGIAELRVSITDSSALGEAPFAFPSDFTPVTLSIEALGYDGARLTDYNGRLRVRVVPGEVDPLTSVVTLIDGVNEAHEARVRYAFGSAYFWVDEIGLDRSDECRDGFDNDEDGLLDYPGDPGCTSPQDPSEGTATYVTGLSDALVFEPIRIRDIQFNASDPTGESPLIGREIRVERGDLIVTNVIENGFYVTDADDDAYNGMFVFNFSFPEGVVVGDRLDWFSGGVAEFVGDTQVTFPAWENDEDYVLSDEDRQTMASCQQPTNPDVSWPVPRLLSSSDLGDLALLEGEESNVVEVHDARISTRFVQCDFDFNGDIDGPDETLCRNDCQNSNLCTELSSFYEFGQFTADVDGAAIQVANAQLVANLDALEICDVISDSPLEYSCPERTLAVARGNLRHIFLTTRIQLWVLLPRFACDLQLACDDDGDCLPGASCNSDNLCEASS